MVTKQIKRITNNLSVELKIVDSIDAIEKTIILPEKLKAVNELLKKSGLPPSLRK